MRKGIIKKTNINLPNNTLDVSNYRELFDLRMELYKVDEKVLPKVFGRHNFKFTGEDSVHKVWVLGFGSETFYVFSSPSLGIQVEIEVGGDKLNIITSFLQEFLSTLDARKNLSKVSFKEQLEDFKSTQLFWEVEESRDEVFLYYSLLNKPDGICIVVSENQQWYCKYLGFEENLKSKTITDACIETLSFVTKSLKNLAKEFGYELKKVSV